MRIVIVASEVVPFSKTGGLGDVTGSLAAALARAGHQVVTVSPQYAGTSAPDAEDTGVSVGLHGAGATHDVRYARVVRDGVHHLLVRNPLFARGGPYGDAHGAYADNHLRFALLSRAGIEAARRVPIAGAPLGEDVLFHVHDWQTALVPVLLEAVYRPLGLFPAAPTVLTLHNLAHQGRFPAAAFPDLDLSPRWFEPWSLEHDGDLALLKGGLLHVDQLTTVSPTYAAEIRTPASGMGLDAILRWRGDDLHGILNGIDVATWDPARDPFLAAPYDADDPSGKARCKAALQAELGLPVDAGVPIVASVGRLDPQKGVDLLLGVVPWLVDRGAQIVVLGAADAAHAAYEDRLRTLEVEHPHAVRARIGFDEGLAHRIEAGADLFVMPSLFEPCGLNQMFSLRYGTVPVVRATGGLADTVRSYDPATDRGNGWTFRPFHVDALRGALGWALTTWREYPDTFAAIRRRGMQEDFSWDARVPSYEEVYGRAAARRPVV